MFKASYNCSDCGFKFEKLTEHDPRKKGRKPSCPECRKGKYSTMKSITKSNKEYTQEELSKNEKEITESRKFPATGNSNYTKAWDATQEMVAQDYQMSDLNTNLREGDSMAPKLRQDLEKKVDGVFKQQKPIMGENTARSMNASLMRQINSGQFRGAMDVVARQQASGIGPPQTNVIFEHGRGKPN